MVTLWFSDAAVPITFQSTCERTTVSSCLCFALEPFLMTRMGLQGALLIRGSTTHGPFVELPWALSGDRRPSTFHPENHGPHQGPQCKFYDHSFLNTYGGSPNLPQLIRIAKEKLLRATDQREKALAFRATTSAICYAANLRYLRDRPLPAMAQVGNCRFGA